VGNNARIDSENCGDISEDLRLREEVTAKCLMCG